MPDAPISAHAPASSIAIEELWSAAPPAGENRGEPTPGALRAAYGGPLVIPLRSDRATILMNFVSTLDGIVALGPGEQAGGAVISGHNEADRFVMALLRAVADVVLMGSGTIAGGSSHQWTAEHLHPASAPAFQEWRAALGLAAQPTVVIVTGSGDVRLGGAGWTIRPFRSSSRRRPPGRGALPSTTCPPTPGSRLRDRAAGCPLRHRNRPGAGRWPGRPVRRRAAPVRQPRGRRPRRRAVPDGRAPDRRARHGPARPGRGHPCFPDAARWQDLASVKRDGDHLFLRYRRRASIGSNNHASFSFWPVWACSVWSSPSRTDRATAAPVFGKNWRSL